MNKTDLILTDAVTYAKISENENYKERLLEAYYILRENNIDSLEKFESSDIGIGAFTYNEITLFDRLRDEEYARALAAFKIKLNEVKDMPKDIGDRLASWGRIGKTPYRNGYIKNGFITTGLTEEEKNKFYR